MKGIVLAGGFGTRLAPFTNVTSKHLAPIYSKEKGAIPIIQYPIETLKKSGIEEILIITSRDHCGHIVQTLGDGKDLGVNLTYKIQEMNRSPTGIAQALKLSEVFVCQDKFAVILGDNFFENSFEKEIKEFKNNNFKSAIFIKEIKDSKRFGVAEIDENGIVLNITEKPKIPKSNWAVTGLYFYTPEVFDILPNLKPSGRGELEITDVNNSYVNLKKMKSYKLKGFWHDMGTVSSMIETQNHINKL